ncbi:hypothetical protein JCM11251_003670 [Rhodosporidiobolus azoricus]
MVPVEASEEEVKKWTEAECGNPEGGAVRVLRAMQAWEGYRSWAVQLWNTTEVSKLVGASLRRFRNNFVVVKQCYSREERVERWNKKQAHLLCIQKTAGTTFPMPAAAAAAEKTTAAMKIPAPRPPLPINPLLITPLPSIPVLTFTNYPSYAPPCNDDNSASDITHASGAKITATVLHEEDPSFPDNQLDDRFALIGDRSWDADASAEFPNVGGDPIEGAAADKREPESKPSYPAAEEGILAQMSVTETSEELRAAFEESMRRVRARGIEEEEDKRREAEEKAKVAEWRAAEWERERAAEAEKLAEAGREREAERARAEMAQRKWEEERERSEEEERLREEEAERVECKEGGNVERVADSADTAGAGVYGIQPTSSFSKNHPSISVPPQDEPSSLHHPLRLPTTGNLAPAPSSLSPPFPPSAIHQVPISSPDVVAVDLQTKNEPVRLVSVYDPHLGDPHKNRSCQEVLPPLLRSCAPDVPLVVAGNFNLRHHEWDPLLRSSPVEEAEAARLTFEDAGLVHLRPPGDPTWAKPDGFSPRTIDLALGNLSAETPHGSPTPSIPPPTYKSRPSALTAPQNPL